MFYYGRNSKKQLKTLHPKLQEICNKILLYRDAAILEGYRSNERQTELFILGRTKLAAGLSKHNTSPSRAMDIIPFPFPDGAWEDREFWVEWSSWVKGLASGMGIKIRSGYDWDNDYDLRDQTFYDGPHFELI